ncbi:MAG: restriction endonuclease subunit S [Paludibacter sp.]
MKTNNIQLPKYPAYKPSGVEWLGEIPEHWEAVSLGSILELKSDKNHPEYEVLSVYREYGVIKKDSRDDNHNATSLDTSNYKAVEPGDLVVNKMKAWQGSMGVSPHKGIVSPAYITCRVDSEKIHPEYLHQLLRCDLYIGEYNRLSYGVRVGQWDMHYEDFKHITTTIPPLSEQTAIANFLDNKTALIDKAITLKEKQIELLKERRQILIHRAVTRGLNPDVKLKDSGVEWIGEIPEGWEVARVKQFTTKISKGTTPSTEGRSILDEGPIRYIKGENIQEGKIIDTPAHFIDEKTNALIRRSELKENDVLFVIAGATLGKIAIIQKEHIPSNTNQAVAFLRPNSKIIPQYLAIWLSSKIITELIWLEAVQSAQPNLSMENLGNFPIILPEIKEQGLILRTVENINSKISTAISLKEKEIEKLKEYKSVLINEAVSGKIKVG